MMETTKYFYDKNFVRYQLVKTNPGNTVNNWLFMPGGPGADSSYFLTLIENLDLPGNYWLIDLPGNGSNISEAIPMDYNFDRWQDYFLSVIERFENPMYVGHSFSGMFPLLFPQLEHLLKGMIILNSTPSLWLEEAAKYAQSKNVHVSLEPLAEFRENPSTETFKPALLACLPYYFPEESFEIGRQLFDKMCFNYLAAAWWLNKAQEINYDAKWVPQCVPTLILGASHDLITPYTMFANDKRFDRQNITIKTIENAGHFPWMEQMEVVASAFRLLEWDC